MAGAEGFEPSARGFGGNVEFYLALRLLPDFWDLLPAAPLMIQELMLFWWYAEFFTRFLMLLMMNLDSTVWVVVGIEYRSREQDGRLAMNKICVALIKEKGIRSNNISFRLNHQVNGTTFSINSTTIIGCIVPDHIRLVKIEWTHIFCVALNKEKTTNNKCYIYV